MCPPAHMTIARRQGERLGLMWLAGVLEAEGTFLKPPPSGATCPIVACRMTDADVIARVAARFGVTVQANGKGRYRTEYAATLKGAAAVALMRDLRPLMGERRRSGIDAAVAEYRRPARKLSYARSQRIRKARDRGESVSSLARRFDVSRPTIRAVLQGRIYREPQGRPWMAPLPCRPIVKSDLRASVEELCWLAGWLEGEGSFLKPPPSDPRRCRIKGVSRDADVVARVARILCVSPTLHREPRGRDRGWSPVYAVLQRGSGAVHVMEAMYPLMGERRQGQIRRALDTLEPEALAAKIDEHNGGVLASTWS